MCFLHTLVVVLRESSINYYCLREVHSFDVLYVDTKYWFQMYHEQLARQSAIGMLKNQPQSQPNLLGKKEEINKATYDMYDTRKQESRRQDREQEAGGA